MQILVSPLHSPHKEMNRSKTFLGLIRGVAMLAPNNLKALADNAWLWEDEDYDFILNYGSNIMSENVIVWQDLVMAFVEFLNVWMRNRQFFEIEARFITAQSESIFGKIQARKWTAEETNLQSVEIY